MGRDEGVEIKLEEIEGLNDSVELRFEMATFGT